MVVDNEYATSDYSKYNVKNDAPFYFNKNREPHCTYVDCIAKPDDDPISPLGGVDDDEEGEVSLPNYSTFQFPLSYSNFFYNLYNFSGYILRQSAMLLARPRQSAGTKDEVSSLLRFLCFIGGAGMLLSSSLAMLKFFSLISNPTAYILHIYHAFFGIAILINEAKDWECLDQFKPWITLWFKFLTVPAGKGTFYIFVGFFGISLWLKNILLFTTGIYMTVMGFFCLLIHFGIQNKQLPSDIPRQVLSQHEKYYMSNSMESFYPSHAIPNSPSLEEDADDDIDDELVQERFHCPPVSHSQSVYAKPQKCDTITTTTTDTSNYNISRHTVDRSAPLLKNNERAPF